ncbi:precorrin-2 dehydrogenase/sirohydrochlorin ferrochelatase family protein [Halorubrum vacuolatum]|uniref:precorrin-2 dehydrogenase n=1 Tax=Halorubrum vacuolatum TaxID=63740 RepID=A0A238UTJ4_HALVU|nr:bifunctional precorrin-2 dehydrogenase/sirohydrochlorin ferrochelatase [Halorubrum vacuolatum]SNR25368.1 precorrin-2 dehydrogenase / sirohydrochlorin ferrochelatase [Halorubrum vacuolatum]
MIPLYHDFVDETVLIFGGGSVGARKARRFAAEARVVVVSPTFDESLIELSREGSAGNSDADIADSLTLVRAAPEAGAIDGWIDRVSPALVVAATDDPTINDAIEAVTEREGVLINRTDVSGGRRPGSVVVPGTVEDGPISVAISTGGTSPALTRVLRERIGTEIDGAGEMAALSGSIRTELQERSIDPDERRAAVRAVVRSDRVWKALQEGRSKGRKEAEKVIEEVLHG